MGMDALFFAGMTWVYLGDILYAGTPEDSL